MATRFLPLSFPLVFLLAVAPACADTILYENGSLNENGGVTANTDIASQVTDSFTLTSDSIVTGLEFAVVISSGASPVSVSYTIGTSPFGDSVGDLVVLGMPVVGQSGVTDSGPLCNDCATFVVYSVSIPISPGLTLEGGTYWLSLNGFSSSERGADGYWDESDGPSTAYIYDGATGEDVSIGSEWFEIIGNAVPEPSSLTFVVLGCLLLAGWKSRARRLVRGSHR